MIALVAFLLAGLSHSAVAWTLGCKDWALDTQWFLLNFAGCALERWVLATVRRLAARMQLGRQLAVVEDSWLGWGLGYAWTFAFFFATVPLWRFPRLFAQLNEVERWTRIFSSMTVLPPTSTGVA